jgi:hypothetical protein
MNHSPGNLQTTIANKKVNKFYVSTAAIQLFPQRGTKF